MTAPISFSGLSSGIDTNSIIQQLLDAHRQPIVRLENKAEVLAVQREAYRNVNTQLLAVQSKALDLRLESTFLTRSASSSDESSVVASANFASVKTTHRVEISQLAQEAIASSSRYLSQTRLLGSNTVGINLLGGASRTNAPGAGRIKGGVTLDESTTLGDLGLASDFTLRIDPDGAGSHSSVTIRNLDASTSVGQMLTEIRNQVGPVKAHVVFDEATGGNVLQISSEFVGIDLSVTGAVAEATLGIDNGQTVNTSSSAGAGSSHIYAAVSPSDLQRGEYTVVSSNGMAGSLTGTVDLAAAAGGGDLLAVTLDDLNVNDFEPLLIDPDAAGGTGSMEILKTDGTSLSGTDTIGDLLDAINHSMPDVTAQVVEGAGGTSYLKISSNEGGRDFSLSETGANNGILKRVFGLGVDNHTTSNSTTSSDDVTLVAKFYPRGNLESSGRRVISGVKDDYRIVGVNDLIDGVTVIGSTLGDVFTPGSARIQLNNSDSLSVNENYKTQLFGRTGVTADSYATGLAIDSDSSGVIGLNKPISELNSSTAFSYDDGLGITTGTFVVGDTTLTITQDEIDNGITIAHVLARINSANEGVSVSYDSGIDRLVATAGEYGSRQEIRFANFAGGSGESNVLKVLGLTNSVSEISISAGADAGNVDSEAELVQAAFSIRPTSGTFTINGISIEVDVTSDSLTEVIEKINTSAAGVTANIDPVSNRVTLLQDVDSDTTFNWITVGSSSDTSNILDVLRITGGANADSSIVSTEQRTKTNKVGSERKTAELKVDNVQYTRNTNSIDDITSGITYDLRGVSSSPVTVSVIGDTERPLEAIARWVTEYNKTIKLLDPGTLDGEQKEFLDPITDSERSSMTFDELVKRLDLFDKYNKQEAIRKESNFRILKDQLRSAVFNQVDIPGSSIRSIADLGIGTGTAGSPLTTNYQGVLVADSTDYDEILEILQDNEKLKKALEEDDRSVYKLFAQRANSEVQVKGTTAFDEESALANDIAFQISDGTNSTEITLPAGTTNPNEFLSIITNKLNNAGLTGLEASFDTTGHLRFSTSTNVGRAYIRIFDLTDSAETDRLSTRFGVPGGSFVGENARDTAGIAEKSHSVLRSSTSLSGFISQKASYGGVYSQGSIFDEIVALQEQILRIEDRVAKREESLRKQYAAMESSLAKLQEQQGALSQYMGAAAAGQTTFGGG